MNLIAYNFNEIAPPGTQMSNLCQQQLNSVKQMMDFKTTTIDPEMNRVFGQPIQNYMGQFREIGVSSFSPNSPLFLPYLKERIRERNRRKGEMEKLEHTRDKQKAKGDPRLGGTETRLTATTG